MSFYFDYILPHLIDLTMRNRRLAPYRERVISGAAGRVLEIGIGSGLNLPLYSSQVKEILGLEPSARLLEMSRRTAARLSLPIRLVEGSVEAIPIDDRSIDTAVSTWTLCTIPDAGQALREICRVLRPGGQLRFVEHGRAPDASVRNWQDRLTPAWKRVAGGCHLNRPIKTLIENAGFNVTEVETGYLPKSPRVMAYLYEGQARAT
jgi:ubiquinone/menaquinone biosynthesis C-methylase UbiE